MSSPADHPLDSYLTIHTPEHLTFRVQLAGPARRALAWGVDMLLWFALLILLGIFNTVLGTADFEGLSQGVRLLGMFALWWGYFIGWELFTRGRSPGKLALGIRVVEEGNLPLGYRACILRNLLRAADFLVLPSFFVLVGPAVMAADVQFRRLGDWVAGTVVVYERTEEKERRSVNPPARNEYLLPRILFLTKEEREAIALFAHRSLGPLRRQELAQLVVPTLARRFAVDEPRDPVDWLMAVHARSKA